MKFKLTEIIKEFAHIEEKYGYIEVKKVYECENYDDLQNLFLTLVDFSTGPLTFTVEKTEAKEDE